MDFFGKHWPLYMALGVISILGVFILLCVPFDSLISNVFPDDAFYYFKIAEHILAGNGSTFDGIHFTNGYHPLWLLMLLPVFAIFGTAPALAPLYAIWAIDLLLFVATTVVLYMLIAHYTESRGIRAFALCVWVFNPFLWYEFLNGLETGLMLFLLALFIYGAARLKEARRTSSLHLWALLGALGGLLTLARLDAIFYPAFFFAYIFFTAPRERFRPVLVAGLTFCVVVFPWFLWNYMVSGMFFTSASIAHTMVNHHLVFADNGPGIFTLLKATLSSTYRGITLAFSQTGALFLCLFSMGFGTALFLRARVYRSLSWRTLPPELVLFGGFVLLFLANAAVRWSMRSWYFIAIHLFFVLALTYVSTRILEELEQPRLLVVFFICSFLPLTLLAWDDNLRDREVAAREMRAAAIWSNEHLPVGSTIGVFNAGVQAYFSEHRVVNLDGLVNNDAFEAMRAQILWRYIETASIEYIIDFDPYIAYRYRDFFGADPFLHLEEIERIRVSGYDSGNNGVAVYRVKRSR